MAYLSLYRKYRPQTFSDILGQSHVSKTLTNAISEDRVAHAYLFTGPRGTGKTSTARILAKALNCAKGPTPQPCGVCESCRAIAEGSSMDVIEMDAASHSKVEETRDILTGVALATAGGRKKIYVIDEVHMLTTQSFNALLKTLEEPPDHVVFVLATTEAHKVLPTIISRTQRFDFRRVPADEIETHLGEVAKHENIDIDPGALTVLARHAEGSVRDALSGLDQLSSLGGRVAVEDAERLLGERDEDAFVALFEGIAAGEVGAVFSTINALVSEGADVRQLAHGILGHARSLLLLKTAPQAEGLLDVSPEDVPRLADQAERFTPGTLSRILDLVSTAATDMRNAPNHRLLLEVALVRAAAPETDPSATGLLGRIERLERRMSIDAAAEAPATPAPAPGPKAAGRPAAKPAPGPKAAGRPAPKPAPRRAPARAESRPEAAPEAAPPAPAETQAVPGPRGGVGIGPIRDAWDAALAEVNKVSKRVAAFLNPSQPLALEGDTLVVEVRSPWHAEAMSDQGNRDKLLAALHAVLGVKPVLTFVAQGDQGGIESAGDDTETHDTAVEIGSDAAAPDPVELVKRGLSAEVVEEIEEKR